MLLALKRWPTAPAREMFAVFDEWPIHTKGVEVNYLVCTNFRDSMLQTVYVFYQTAMTNDADAILTISGHMAL